MKVILLQSSKIQSGCSCIISITVLIPRTNRFPWVHSYTLMYCTTTSQTKLLTIIRKKSGTTKQTLGCVNQPQLSHHTHTPALHTHTHSHSHSHTSTHKIYLKSAPLLPSIIDQQIKHNIQSFALFATTNQNKRIMLETKR